MTAPDSRPDDLPEDGVIGTLPEAPGPTGTGQGTDQGADPDAPDTQGGDA